MSPPIMVDSSWYIREARSGRDPLAGLAMLAEGRDLAVCGMIMAEVGRGLREARYLQRYQRAWKFMRYVPSDLVRWEETLAIAWQLDREGKVIPLQDLHIAVCAASIGAVVLTADAHFHQIPGVVAADRVV
jgi:predicted nucleic acid-binding protein